eukprot:scaffold28837_cov116-Isochrysis_galbana.AAC.2
MVGWTSYRWDRPKLRREPREGPTHGGRCARDWCRAGEDPRRAQQPACAGCIGQLAPPGAQARLALKTAGVALAAPGYPKDVGRTSRLHCTACVHAAAAQVAVDAFAP